MAEKTRKDKIEDVYDLSPLQEGILYHYLEDNSLTGYVVQNMFHVDGVLHSQTMEKALFFLSRRHDVTRSAIIYERLNKPRQVVLKEKKIAYHYMDISGIETSRQREEVNKIAQNDIEKGYNLAKDSLMRVTHIKTGEETSKLIWNFHHIIMDGWCLSLILGDFFKYYNWIEEGRSEEYILEEVERARRKGGKYSEYIQWLGAQDKEEGLHYWKEVVADYEESAQIKSVETPKKTKEQMNRLKVSLGRGKSRRLMELAKKNQVTINTVMEAAWGVVLQKYNNSEDVVFGKVVSGRNADIEGIEEIVGLFVNTVPVRVKCDKETKAKHLWKELQRQGNEGNNYHYCSLADIQRQSGLGADFIQTLFVFENFYVDKERLSQGGKGLSLKMESAREQTNYSISISASYSGEQLNTDVMYNPNEYGESEMQRLLERMQRVLEQFAEDEEIKIKELNLLCEEEKDQVLSAFQDTSCIYPREKTVVELFEEQVEEAPEKTAVVYDGKNYSYRELNERANQIAHLLREKGVERENYVGIMCEPSFEIIIGIYGILKAGGAYLPMDPEYPKERIRYMIEDSKPKIILTYKAQIETEVEVLSLAETEIFERASKSNPVSVNTPKDLIYVIYTSGTTGKPKGVQIEHHNVVNFCYQGKTHQLVNELKQKCEYIYASNKIIFDITVQEIFLPLLNQIGIVIAKDAMIYDEIEQKNLGLISTPTKFSNYMTQPAFREKLKDFKVIMLGAEEFKTNVIKDILQERSITLINGYGPTETTCGVLYYRIWDENIQKVPIGKPMNNTRVYILEGENLCGIGMPGELCIAGDGLARGYLNQEELTREKFIDNPYGAGKLYRTGDLARWLLDGNVEYLGRVDEQVKIRGYRIELGEIETVLKKQQGVKDAAVVVWPDRKGDKALHGYVVAEDEVKVSSLREGMSKELPEYMVPAYLMKIAKIPVTQSGKLDKRSLPQIEAKTENPYISPRNEREAVLCEIFKEILGVHRVSVKDSFFELGGDSIKGIRVVSKIREAGYDMNIKDVMSGRTVEEISERLKKTEVLLYEQGEVRGNVQTTPIIEAFRSWELEEPHHFNQEMMMKVDGNETQVEEVLKSLVSHHDMLRGVYRNETLEILSNEGKCYNYEVYDLCEEEKEEKKIEAKCEEIQKSMDLEKGPLFSSILFKVKDGNYLFLCMHHLIVDGVSWRIVTEDIKRGLKQLREGKEIVLPKKTASYIEWAETLSEYKKSEKLEKERDYWKEIEEKMSEGRYQGEKNAASGYGTVAFQLEEEETEKLIKVSGKTYNTEINDLLLSGLGMAVKQISGQNKLAVMLEGHGREELHKKIEVDRTVGWFTSMYPVIVECYEEVKESIVRTKEMLRKVPNHGIGYGLLKQRKEESDISFNYLGEMEEEKETGRIYNTGTGMSEKNRLPGGLTINGSVHRGQLVFVFRYDKSRYTKEEMSALAGAFKEKLKEEIFHCCGEEKRILTPSDCTTKSVTLEEIKALNEMAAEYEIEDIMDMTPMQEGMLFYYLNDRKSTGYVVQNVITVKGKLDPQKLEKAVEYLTIRHDVIRMSMMFEGMNRPRQVLQKGKKMEYNNIDLRELTEEKQEQEFREIVKNDVNRGYDLTKDSLMRLTQVRIGADTSKLIWNFHHIIMDGWCLSLVLGDLLKYYSWIEEKSETRILEEIEQEKRKGGKYSDYIQWLDVQDKKEGLTYWRQVLEDYEEVAEIKSVQIPKKTKEQVNRVKASLGTEESRRLIEVAKENQVTINTVMEAAWGVVLQRYNNSEDVVFGKVVSGRNGDIEGIEEIVGLFVNTIPVRVKSGKETRAKDLWKILQQQGNDGNSYHYCSLANIQGESKLGAELIKTLFVFENYYVNKDRLNKGGKGLSLQIDSAREQTNYSVSVSANYDGEQLNIEVMYNPNEYGETEIQRLLMRIERVLKQFAENEEIKIKELNLLNEEEKDQVLRTFNQTDSPYPREKTVVELLEEQVEKCPQKTAVVYEGKSLSYQELNEKANQLAHVLREKGVKRESYVGILSERSLEMIVAIYGIIKAGGAYIPMDPDYPKERIRYILEDSNPEVVLTYQAEIETEREVIDLCDSKLFETTSKNNPERINKADDLMYVIYTSGTTGKPKGVQVEHRSVVNLKYYLKKTYEVTEKDKVLQFANYVFDASVWEMTMALLNGAMLMIPSVDLLKDTKALADYCNKQKISIATLPPNYFVNMDGLHVDTIITAGSESSKEVVEKAEYGRYINAYGPTENTVVATHWERTKDWDVSQNLSIGTPVSNTRIYILDGNSLCGIGLPGELCIAGDGLARGYLNQEKLTKEKFIENPYAEGKLYRTGDVARWLENGDIDYLGRMDDQVKIRGYRIELGEIESALRKQPGVKEAAVIVRTDKRGDKALHGYVVVEENVKVSDLKENLSKELPEYMVPNYLAGIERIPINKSGKLDKKNLPEIEVKTGNMYVGPANEREAILCEIFEEILGVEKVSVKDSFFELGGDSLKAIRAYSMCKLRELDITVRDILLKKTVEEIVRIENTNFSIKRINDIYNDRNIVRKNHKVWYDRYLKYQDNVVRNEFVEVIEPLEMHKFFINYETSVCPSVIEINGVEEKEILEAVKKMIEEQEVLRMAYSREAQCFRVFASADWMIPIYNWSQQDEVNCYQTMMNQHIPQEGQLMSTIMIMKKGWNHYQLHIYVHHSLWDRYSYEILLQQLKDKIGNVHRNFHIREYREYIQMKKEDCNSSKENMDTLRDCINNHSSLIDELGGHNYAMHYVGKINKQLAADLADDPIEGVMKQYAKLNNLDTRVSKFPFMILKNDRNEADNYTLGMYLDIILDIYDTVIDRRFGTLKDKENGLDRSFQNYSYEILSIMGKIVTINYDTMSAYADEELEKDQLELYKGNYSLRVHTANERISMTIPLCTNNQNQAEEIVRQDYWKG